MSQNFSGAVHRRQYFALLFAAVLGVGASIAAYSAGAAWESRLAALPLRNLALVAGIGMIGFLVVCLMASIRQTARLVCLTTSLQRTTAELRRESEKVAYLTRHDALTGLVNRSAFAERLRDVFTVAGHDGAPFAVLCLDLDHFKDVNDALGHSQGDELLRIVASRLQEIVREIDVIARLDGDEFAILLTEVTDPSSVAVLATRINKSLSEPYRLGGNEAHVCASIGIARSDATPRSPEEMMMQADLALYRAKEAGRNQFCFHSPELDRRMQERIALADDLRGALERKELELHYQPQVEIGSGRIVGLEALVRWNHPVRGLLPAAAFVPIAETTGAIFALGHWVVAEACRQIVAWQAEGLAPPTVAVNLSAAQFKGAPDLDRDLANMLAGYGLEPRALEIELTELALRQAAETHGHLLDRIRMLGIGIAIDNFGTGYSSLETLRSCPVSHLKIAQPFVRRLPSNPGDAAVVRAALAVAHEFGIEVTAEGVETSDELACLASLGCRHAQGFLFSPPVPARRAATLMRRGRIEPSRALADVASPSLTPVHA